MANRQLQPTQLLLPLNIAITCFALADDADACVDVFHRMLRAGVYPNGNTLYSLLQYCNRNKSSGFCDAVATFNRFHWNFPDVQLGVQVR